MTGIYGTIKLMTFPIQNNWNALGVLGKLHYLFWDRHLFELHLCSCCKVLLCIKMDASRWLLNLMRGKHEIMLGALTDIAFSTVVMFLDLELTHVMKEDCDEFLSIILCW